MNMNNRFRWLVCAAALAAAVVAVPIRAQEDPPIELQVMIRLAPGYSIDAFNQQYGTQTLRSIVTRNTHLLLLPEGTNEEAWNNALRQNPPPGYLWSEINYDGQDGEGRTGSFYVAGVNARNRYGTQYSRATLRLAEAHQTATGQGVIVAVLDTGVDATHPELIDRLLPNGYNFVDDNANTLDLPDGQDNDGDTLIDESHGHGTFMAGLVAMVAPDAKILPIKVLNSDGHGDGFLFAAGVYYAIDQGADVINMSLGSTYNAKAVEEAIAEAVSKGIVVVGAAGNMAWEEPREYPAMRSEVIGVVAVDENDIKAPFSNYNRKASLSAPGVGIYSTIPTDGQGYQYAEWLGTSPSTALVSGAAALVSQRVAHMPRTISKSLAIRAALEGSSVPIDHLNLPEYERMLGVGRVDAAAAMTHDVSGTWLTGAIIRKGSLVGDGPWQGLIEVGGGQMRVRSVLAGTGNHRMDLIVDATTTISQPSGIDLKVRSRLSVPAGTARLFLRDFTTNKWVKVDEYALGRTMQAQRVNGLPAGNFIDSAGRIRVMIRHVVTVPPASNYFDSFIDQVQVTVRR